ncbi:MAG TPA: A/G-specific adenine glycosylase [Thermomicrobiales bacterium]|nr:A/G-specific adenine glycosylase [Thermomicrobiales bacterium]
MNELSDARIEEIRAGLLAWYAANHRDLPWRHTRDPYRVLVSEVMLQQTQVDRVIPYYGRWLTQFPTVEALADAPTADVITAWSGLGYNRRAVYLQKTARAVVDEHGGVFPSTREELLNLPGVGPYTAGAIAAFAFEQDVAFMDTNIRRVVHRLIFGSDVPARQATERDILAAAERLVPEGAGWVWNQAMIEFGALQCTQRRPACVICPLQRACSAFPAIQSDIAELPAGVRLKNEANFHGSNRQFRGRVVEELRRSSSATLAELGPKVKHDFAEQDLPWLYGVVSGLARDGLVAIREPAAEYDPDSPAPGIVVALPD